MSMAIEYSGSQNFIIYKYDFKSNDKIIYCTLVVNWDSVDGSPLITSTVNDKKQVNEKKHGWYMICKYLLLLLWTRRTIIVV